MLKSRLQKLDGLKYENLKENSRDIFSIYQENAAKMFNGVKQSVPQYHQSIIFSNVCKYSCCTLVIDYGIVGLIV